MWPFFKNLILDFFFPTFCANCGQFGPYLCAICFETLQFSGQPISLQLENPAIDQVIAGFEYSYAIKPLLHQLKYQSVRGIGRYLGDLLYLTTSLPPVDLITAVPLHPKRQTDRGFNQAEEIARQLSAHLGVAYIPLTRRLRASVSQASIRSRQKRLKNLEGMFGLVKNAPPLTGKTILLVDDVCTTGTTLNECAKILKQAGAKTVLGLVVAHGN